MCNSPFSARQAKGRRRDSSIGSTWRWSKQRGAHKHRRGLRLLSLNVSSLLEERREARAAPVAEAQTREPRSFCRRSPTRRLSKAGGDGREEKRRRGEENTFWSFLLSCRAARRRRPAVSWIRDVDAFLLGKKRQQKEVFCGGRVLGPQGEERTGAASASLRRHSQRQPFRFFAGCSTAWFL